MTFEISFLCLLSITLCLQPNDYTATITFEELGPSYIGTGVTINGTTATITTAGSFLLTGKTTEGNVIIKTSSVNLYLENLNLTSNITSPIVINSKLNDITITSLENVILTDNENPNVTLGECAVIKVKKNSEVTIENQKDFTLIGTCKNIIKGGTQASIKFGSSNGEYTIKGYKNGISSDHYLEFNGGIFNITTETGDGIKSTPDDTDLTSEGKLVINNGEFNIESYADAFQAKKIMNINGGTFNIKTENGSDSTTFDGDIMSAKGFKISNNETGCEMVIKGGNFYLNTADDAFHSNGNLTIIGGIFEIYSGDDGINAEFNLTFGEKDTKNGPTINILKSYEGLEARYITIYYAKIDLIASDDGINAAGGSEGSDPGPPPGPPPSFNSKNLRNQPPEPPGPQPPGPDPGPGPGPTPGPSPSGNNDLFVSIYDGIINVLCSGDGIDSNGAVYIYGGEIKVISQGTREGQDNEPIDHEGDFILLNGELLLGGNKGMEYVHNRITKGNQKYAYYTSNIEENKIIKIKNDEGKEIKNVNIPKSISYVFYSSSNLNDKFKFYQCDSSGGNEKEISFSFGTLPTGEDSSSFMCFKKIVMGILILLILF